MTKPVDFAGRRVGAGNPCFIIAEAGVNHDGDLGRARRLADAAHAAGADAVKFQAFIPEELATADADKAGYQRETTGCGGQLEMLRALALSPEDQKALKAHCERVGITYLCTPYENNSADLLHALDVQGFKLGSTDTANVPFLRHLAAMGRPLILSTGMCDLDEVRVGVEAFLDAGGDGRLVLMHCVSQYPSPLDQSNLRAIRTLEDAFRVPVGFSDHTKGVEAGPLAVAAGACCVEKHFTLDRSALGPDHKASVEPAELSDYVGRIRRAEEALGDGVKRVMPCEAENKKMVRKSLVAARRIEPGARIGPEDLACKRPATGLAPKAFDHVVGRRAARAIERDEAISESALE